MNKFLCAVLLLMFLVGNVFAEKKVKVVSFDKLYIDSINFTYGYYLVEEEGDIIKKEGWRAAVVYTIENNGEIIPKDIIFNLDDKKTDDWDDFKKEFIDEAEVIENISDIKYIRSVKPLVIQ